MPRELLRLPALPFDAWKDSQLTLHLYVQIVGKIRLALMPRKNHWWYLTLYVSPKGLTTHAIAYSSGAETFEITINLIDHRLDVVTSQGAFRSMPLEDGLSVADFYHHVFRILRDLDIEAKIVARPFDMPVAQPFEAITEVATYQPDYVERFWRVLRWVDGVFKEFSGRFYGKTSPVHLYWHHMDLAVTRFSGRRGPALDEGMRLSDKDAYTHEVISSGFWAGDENVPGAAFYTYAYPSPDGLDQEPLTPSAAQWVESNGSPMALLMYDDLRRQADPRQALLDFMEQTYQAGARRAGWDVEALTVPPLSAL